MGADTSIFRSQFCLFEEAGGEYSRPADNGFRRRGGGLLEKDMGGRETVARQNDLRGGCKNLEEHQDRVGERGGGQVVVKRDHFSEFFGSWIVRSFMGALSFEITRF